MGSESLSKQHPFLSWFHGTGSIALAVYIVALSPYELPLKIIGGFVLTLVCGYFLLTLYPNSYLNLARTATIWRSIVTILFVAGLHFYHGLWLSGSWFGWISPIFPLLGVLLFIANGLHLLDLW
jgi:hypothetical protein